MTPEELTAIREAMKTAKVHQDYRWMNDECKEQYTELARQIEDIKREYQKAIEPIVKLMANLHNIGTEPFIWIEPKDKEGGAQ